MGKCRDLDVFLARVRTCLERLGVSSKRKQEILGIIQSKRLKSRQELIKLLKSSRHTKILKKLKQVASSRNKRVLKSQPLLKGVFKALSCKVEGLSPEELHKMRMTIKNMRYACEFLEGFYDKRKMNKITKEIIKIQDVLGEYHDANNAVMRLKQIKRKNKLPWLSDIIKMEKRKR
jgi:adenylate cyclase